MKLSLLVGLGSGDVESRHGFLMPYLRLLSFIPGKNDFFDSIQDRLKMCPS